MDQLWSGEVEQVTNGDERVRLRKQVLRLPSQGGQPRLAIVRKFRVEGPTLPPVLLVHGFAQNRYSWHTSRRSLSAWLADAGFDVWNLELRGHGRSVEGARVGAESFADYVADVLHAAAHLPTPGFWIGHSLGGAALYGAATEAASRPAIRPRGVIGVGALYGFAQANLALRAACQLTHSFGDPLKLGGVQVRTRLGGKLLAKLYGVTDILGYASPISGWWPGSMEPDLLEERLTKGFDWTSGVVWREMSRWASSGGVFDYDAAWRKTDVPLLVLLGDKDHLLSPTDGRLAYDRSGSSDRELVILDDYRHRVHWGHLDLLLGRDAPTEVWPLMRAWMAARAAPARAVRPAAEPQRC